MTTFALSTWSLHRTLGSYYADSPTQPRDGVAEPRWGAAQLSLLDLPSELRGGGYDTLQICHFHLPSRDDRYLAELRSALAEADVALDAVLVDDGDLTSATAADQHEAWVADWLDTATALGADKARVIAGMATPTSDRLTDSAHRLRRLADAHSDVRVVTENWMDLLPTSTEVTTLLQQTGDRVGLCIDLGNWTGDTKYEQLAAVTRFAETCHAKCGFTTSGPDVADFRRSLRILRDGSYVGPLALIYDGPDPDEWSMLEQEMQIVESVFG